jgi:predicted acetyltransferase
MDTLELAGPTPALAEAYLEMCREEIADDHRLSGVLPTTLDDLLSSFQRWEEQERVGDESTGGVPCSTYWLVRNGREVLGSSRLRHWLTPDMEETTGHIDYGLRPSARGKGHGTTLLRLTLEKAREMGLREALVMCRKANVASARVIERNSGVLLGECTRATDGETILRYGISLPQVEQ